MRSDFSSFLTENACLSSHPVVQDKQLDFWASLFFSFLFQVLGLDFRWLWIQEYVSGFRAWFEVVLNSRIIAIIIFEKCKAKMYFHTKINNFLMKTPSSLAYFQDGHRTSNYRQNYCPTFAFERLAEPSWPARWTLLKVLHMQRGTARLIYFQRDFIVRCRW